MPSEARILVVDDEPKICRMLQAALQREGYAVRTSVDGAVALEQFRAAPYDMVISDIRMPGVGGLELIRQIKESRPETIVVAITGHATLDTAVQALQHGADDYITKPLDIEQLRLTVETALRNSRLLQGAGVRPRAAQAESKMAAAPSPSATQDLLEANRRLEQRVAELISIQEISQTVTSELRLDRLLQACVGSVSSATGARTVSILLLDRRQECLVVRARRGRDRRRVVGECCPLNEGLAGWVAEHRVPLLIPDVEAQPAFRALARGSGYQSGSVLAVPLLFSDRLVGVLCATEKAEGKPFDERDLRLGLAIGAQIGIAVENARLYETLQRSAFDALRALAKSLEARGDYFRGHSERVADYAEGTARELGLSRDEIDTLRRAAQIHDIGNIAISDTILGRPGPLSDEEHAAVRQHPVRGERIVQTLGFLDTARPLVRHHHERWDGQGYPDGLEGRQIDPLTRILTVADAFDAMTSRRPHRPAMSADEALAELARCAGTQFDPGLVDAFGRAVGGLA